jgi:hypothetical protein
MRNMQMLVGWIHLFVNAVSLYNSLAVMILQGKIDVSCRKKLYNDVQMFALSHIDVLSGLY